MRNVKKSKKADLERRKFSFFEIGLILSLAFVIFAFEWRSYEILPSTLLDNLPYDIADVELVVRTEQKEPLAPPPIKIVQTTLMEIVEDEVEVDDEIEINVDDEWDIAIEEYKPPLIEEIEEEDIIPYHKIEDRPEFIGGNIALMKFLGKNIKYPQMAKETAIDGTVYISFIIEKDGSLSSVKLVRGIGGGCNEEAMRVIKLMPKWKPGSQRGIPVRVSFVQPIKYFLQ